MTTKLSDLPPRKPPARHFTTVWPPDVAELLHRQSYETGHDKKDLVVFAVRKTYGETAK